MTVPHATYVGIQHFEQVGVLLLVNGTDGSTRALVAYFDSEPVLITEKGECDDLVS